MKTNLDAKDHGREEEVSEKDDDELKTRSRTHQDKGPCRREKQQELRSKPNEGDPDDGRYHDGSG